MEFCPCQGPSKDPCNMQRPMLPNGPLGQPPQKWQKKAARNIPPHRRGGKQAATPISIHITHLGEVPAHKIREKAQEGPGWVGTQANQPMAEQSAVAMLPAPRSDASHAVSVGKPNMTLVSNYMQSVRTATSDEDKTGCHAHTQGRGEAIHTSTSNGLPTSTD